MPEATKTADNAQPKAKAAAKDKEKARREIPGNLIYLSSYGAIKTVLDKIVDATVPDKFSQDYLATVLGCSGGSYRPVIPILKRIGFLNPDGTPTERYSRFRTEGSRASAVYQGLREGFQELYKRNEHVHAASDSALTDYIVEVTGLTKDDPVVRSIKGTFKTLSGYLPKSFTPSQMGAKDDRETRETTIKQEEHGGLQDDPLSPRQRPELNLSYQINIVLPDTKDIEVFNSIFRSLRENLLK